MINPIFKEISFGAVVFRKEEEKIYYLILQHKKDYFNFPKGHPEKGESPIKTVKREIFEETGIRNLKIIRGFKEKNNYFFRQDKKLIFKTAIFFLGETKKENITISSEHIGYKWCLYEEALKNLKIKDLRKIIQKANYFLRKKN